MKFPGRRGHKHYFPVTEKGRTNLEETKIDEASVYVVGLDQLLVDIEINVTDEFMQQHELVKGQSVVLDDEKAEKIYQECLSQGLIAGQYPGGAVGNTLHNFSVLSDTPCVALGSIKKNIEVGDYAFKYLCKTSALVDMSYLGPAERPMGRALCFITKDSERSFAISKGCMNDFSSDQVPYDVVAQAAAVLLSAYTLRSENDPIFGASLRVVEIAKEHNVPVILSLGTSFLVRDRKDFLIDFIKRYVNIVAMNQEEAIELTGQEDPLQACASALELTDMALVTVGAKGLYMAGHVDEEFKRRTKEELHSKSIPEYNKYEYSRGMRRKDCANPIKFFTHINPFKGGPKIIANTNGAGDAALAALLHDISANKYHRLMMPNSPKHDTQYLTYSSLSQISKYANRVSFEVLIQNSPRLYKGLPEKEESLEDEYWSL